MKASGKLPLPAWTMLAIPVLAVACTGGPPQAPLTSANDRSPQVRSTLTEAETAYQRGNLPLTEQLLRKAYAGAPDDPDLALDLGDTLNRRQHMESARRHYDEFLERHPSATPVRLALGLTLMRLGQWDEAALQIPPVSISESSWESSGATRRPYPTCVARPSFRPATPRSQPSLASRSCVWAGSTRRPTLWSAR
ncbi:MAG: hypothetical protein DMH00_09130 [Acidobacteria bacterium]|nr:MAG: hypothetical protein DMH00_09130 [Acidobacteriota bacterium]